jgi:hypothetical protein
MPPSSKNLFVVLLKDVRSAMGTLENMVVCFEHRGSAFVVVISAAAVC